jgi:hypothetical protein
MSNIFNARFDLTGASLVSTDIWNVTGTVVDNTGSFGANNVLLGDIIYNDGNPMAMGPLRYTIISIQSVTGSDVECSMQWSIPGEDPLEPIIGSSGCIGRPDVNCVIPITDALQQGIDAAFTNSVRNMESILLSKKLNNITTPVGVMMQAQWDVDNDLKIDLDKLPTLDMGTFNP